MVPLPSKGPFLGFLPPFNYSTRKTFWFRTLQKLTVLTLKSYRKVAFSWSQFTTWTKGTAPSGGSVSSCGHWKEGFCTLCTHWKKSKAKVGLSNKPSNASKFSSDFMIVYELLITQQVFWEGSHLAVVTAEPRAMMRVLSSMLSHKLVSNRCPVMRVFL